MKISQRLAIIVMLTAFEISITIWAAFEISSGAAFHRLNFLHVKYDSIYAEEISAIKMGAVIDTAKLSKMVMDVRQQPIDCLDKIGVIDAFVMRAIGTDAAISLCEKDLEDARKALVSIQQYDSGIIDRVALVAALEESSQQFIQNSNQFDEPINKTVSFILATMIPLVIFISLTNMVSIVYLSRKITSSIQDTVDMLNDDDNARSLSDQIRSNASGELRDLLEAAQERISKDLKTRQTANFLEAEVEKRTASLRQANDELAQFAYRTSHDLKAPLSSSKGLSKLIGIDIDAGDLVEAKLNADKITQQMEKLEGLVVDILELARADLSSTDPELVRLVDLVNEVKTRHIQTLADMKIKFTYEDNGQLVLDTSRIRLTQVLENLISNSIKYCATDDSQRFVRVVGRSTIEGVEISVEDNGLGIAPDQQSQVFELFQRFHPGVADGSGMGLSIVKKHVEKMGGKIACQTLSVGTRFVLNLPHEASRQVA